MCDSLIAPNAENEQKALFRFLTIQQMHYFLSLKILFIEYVYRTEIKHIYVKATWLGYQFFSEGVFICKS